MTQPHAQAWPVDQPFTLGQMAPKQPRRNRMIWVVVALAAAVVTMGGLLLTLVVFDEESNPLRQVVGPDTITIDGTMVLYDDDGYTGTATDCAGRGGYRDIRQGAQVTITDSAGATIALTALGAGTQDGRNCVFSFKIDVPAGKGFYGVEVSRRGAVRYAEQDLAKKPIALSLGG